MKKDGGRRCNGNEARNEQYYFFPPFSLHFFPPHYFPPFWLLGEDGAETQAIENLRELEICMV